MNQYCKAGHLLTPETAYQDGRGGLTCRVCKRKGSKQGYVEWVHLQMHLWARRSQRDWYERPLH